MKVLYTFLSLFLASLVSAQGAGSAIDFTTNSTAVRVPHRAALNTGNEITLEAWINAEVWSANSWENVIIGKDGWASGSDGYSLRGGANGILSFNLATAGSWIEVTSPGGMAANRWYHIAATYDGTTMLVYVNGVQVGSGAHSGPIPDSTHDLEIGRNPFTAARDFKGKIDDVKIWNKALTETEIRDWMCKRLTNAHPQFASLVNYFPFDESTGNATSDPFNGIIGALVDSPTWISSGAAIGDESVADYSGPIAPSITLADGSSFTADNFTATTGAQVYVVNDRPIDISNSLSGDLDTTRYFGVFAADNDPSYSVLYDYSGNIVLTGSFTEGDARLAQRSQHNLMPWSMLSNQFNTDVNNNTISFCEITTDLEFIGGFDSGNNATPVAICDTDSLFVGGVWQNTAGTYLDTTTSAIGCQVIGLVDLSVNAAETTMLPAESICNGDTIMFGSIQITEYGIYSETFSNAAGCDSTVTLNVGPEFVTVLPAATICATDSVLFNGNYISDQGFYSDTLMSFNGCDSIVELDLTIDQANTSVTQIANSLTADQAGLSYVWIDCNTNSPVPGATSQSFNPTVNGDYAVIVTTAGGCSETSTCYSVTGLFLTAPQPLITVDVFPNPTTGSFQILLQDVYENGEVSIFGLDGKLVQQSSFSNKNTIQLDVEGLSEGFYMIQILADDKVGNAKIFKQ